MAEMTNKTIKRCVLTVALKKEGNQIQSLLKKGGDQIQSLLEKGGDQVQSLLEKGGEPPKQHHAHVIKQPFGHPLIIYLQKENP